MQSCDRNTYIHTFSAGECRLHACMHACIQKPRKYRMKCCSLEEALTGSAPHAISCVHV